MSTARCSSCHTFSRNCPPGRPNHKTVGTVGPSCTMNSLGRHNRDQADPTQPHCDYELSGAKCTFFTTPHEFSSLPYPTDITTGPATDSVAPPPPSSSDISELISLLKAQKSDQDNQRVLQQEQAEQMRQLQEQVSSLVTGSTPLPRSNPATIPVVVSTPTITTTTSSPSLPTFTT